MKQFFIQPFLNFIPCFLKRLFVCGIFPLDQILYNFKQLLLFLFLFFLEGNGSGWVDGSSTIWAKITAWAAARGRHCPWRIDFSRAEAFLMASSGRVTSISFFRYVMPPNPSDFSDYSPIVLFLPR